MLDNGIISQQTQIHLFNWHEPFLCPDLPGIVDFLAEKKLHFVISTNASKAVFFAPDILECMDELVVSFSGFTEKNYQKMHGLSFEKVREHTVQMAEDMANKGYPWKMSMSFHVYQYNLKDIREANEFCRVHKIRFNPYFAYFNDYDDFQSYMTGTMDDGLRKQAERELFLHFYEEYAGQCPEDWVCPQERNLVLDERLQVLPCCRVTSEQKIIAKCGGGGGHICTHIRVA